MMGAMYDVARLSCLQEWGKGKPVAQTRVAESRKTFLATKTDIAVEYI